MQHSGQDSRQHSLQHFRLENLFCANCASKIEKALQELPEVQSARVDFAQGRLAIACDDLPKVQALITSLEPQVRMTPLEQLGRIDQKRSSIFTRELFVLLGLIGAFLLSLVAEALLDSLGFGDSARVDSRLDSALLITHIIIYLIAAREVFTRAVASARRREFFDENVLMLVASIAAFLIGASEEAVGIMLFFSAGEYLQNISVRRGRESISALANFTPDLAHRLDSSELQGAKDSKDELDSGVAPESSQESPRLDSLNPLDPLDSARIIDVPASQIRIDDLLLVRAGERVPVDCVLCDLMASFDTSALSGESLPVSVQRGGEILAGSIALDRAVRVRAIRPYEQSQIAKIAELIQSATTKKAHTENFITSFARYYTPVVFVIALLIAFVPPIFAAGGFGANFYEWAYRALVVLMVSCPCALVISVPLGYFGGIVASSRAHILIKGSNYLEALSQLGTIALDKTGTLTKGVFKVTSIVPESGVSERELLGFAACAQNLSNHPIAQSIKNAYQNLAHTHHISEFEEFSGLGVRAVCDRREIIAGNDKILHKFAIPHDVCDIQGTIVHISVDKRYLGYLLIADELKPEAPRVIEWLKDSHITPIMLSGDGEYPCRLVGQKLGIDYHSQLLPQDKAELFAKIKAQNLAGLSDKNAKNTRKQSVSRHKIGFVGDGMNDAPTLALADVGIAFASGSDLSCQNADVLLLHSSLDSLQRAITIAKKTKRIIYENIALALGIKAAFIVLGILGVASIWEAVFGDVGVALLALANAMRTMRA